MELSKPKLRMLRMFDFKLQTDTLKIDKTLMIKLTNGKIDYIFECMDLYYNFYINKVLNEYGYARRYNEATKQFEITKYHVTMGENVNV